MYSVSEKSMHHFVRTCTDKIMPKDRQRDRHGDSNITPGYDNYLVIPF